MGDIRRKVTQATTNEEESKKWGQGQRQKRMDGQAWIRWIRLQNQRVVEEEINVGERAFLQWSWRSRMHLEVA